MIHFEHLAVFAVVAILSVVLLWLLLARNRIKEFHMHFEPDAFPAPVCAFLNSVSVRVLLTLPKKVPADVAELLLGEMSGKQYPVTIDALNWKLTFVIDFYGQVDMGVVSGAKVSLLRGRDLASNSRNCLGHIEGVGLAHKANLQPAEASSDEGTQQGSCDS